MSFLRPVNCCFCIILCPNFILFFFGSYMPISGFHGVLSGFLVGVKQIVPDQELTLLRVKVKVSIL